MKILYLDNKWYADPHVDRIKYFYPKSEIVQINQPSHVERAIKENQYDAVIIEPMEMGLDALSLIGEFQPNAAKIIYSTQGKLSLIDRFGSVDGFVVCDKVLDEPDVLINQLSTLDA